MQYKIVEIQSKTHIGGCNPFNLFKNYPPSNDEIVKIINEQAKEGWVFNKSISYPTFTAGCGCSINFIKGDLIVHTLLIFVRAEGTKKSK